MQDIGGVPFFLSFFFFVFFFSLIRFFFSLIRFGIFFPFNKVFFVVFYCLTEILVAAGARKAWDQEVTSQVALAALLGPGEILGCARMGGAVGMHQKKLVTLPRISQIVGFGICPLQKGDAGSRDSVSRCVVGFLRAGFWGLDQNSSFSRWFCHSRKSGSSFGMGEAQRCCRIPNSWRSHRLCQVREVPGTGGAWSRVQDRDVGLARNVVGTGEIYTFGVELGS